jgi:capsular exopolysaccharide synthesis family protein
MSNIFDALRQAELDRANNAAAQPAPIAAQPIVAPSTTTPAPVVLEAVPDVVFELPSEAVLEVPPIAAPTIPAPIPVPVAAPPIAAPVPQPIPAFIRRSAPIAPPPIAAPPTPAPIFAPPVAAPVASARIAALPVESSTIDLPLDLAYVAPYTWLPSLHQLPALEHRGAAVEQFRSLRSRMQEFRDLNTLKTILVTSGLPQEGKSFVAANLAISFARHKANRVLLIDGDMRRASLHKLLGAPHGPGLTEYLAGKASLTEIMQRPVPGENGPPLPHGLVSLYFIPGGHAGDKAADLSGNRRFDRLIADAAPHFDWIIVDSSPVNLVSDGINLARTCDGVLLIARGGTTKYEVAQRALAELKASKVLGFVLNAVEDSPHTRGYYGYDGYDKIEE